MKIDSAATLRCWSIDVDLAGATYTIPPRPAADWLLAIVDGTWADIVPGLLDDADNLDNLLAEGTIPSAELRTAAQDALAAAAGAKWWSAAQLAYQSTASWISAELLLRGVDPNRVSLAAYLAAALHAATQRMDKNQRARFELDLDRPPSGVAPEEWYDEGEAERNFMTLMANQ
jgi:hypothetical protein